MLAALVSPGCGTVPRGVPATGGMANFGRVNEALFRGAQPDEAGLANLRRLGVRTIINLRQPDDAWPGEETLARAHGIGYVSIPLRGLSAPTDAQVAQVLALIVSSPGPVFVHCEHGADRTGTIVACYRRRYDGWTLERAWAEAKEHGFSPFQIGMRRYLKAYSPAALPPIIGSWRVRTPALQKLSVPWRRGAPTAQTAPAGLHRFVRRPPIR